MPAPYKLLHTPTLCPHAAAAAKLLQLCPTLCDPIDCSPPGSPIPGILQARTLEWVAISFSNAWKWKVKVNSLGRVWLLAIPWTAAYQAPPSMGFSRQEDCSGVPLPSPLPSYYNPKKSKIIELAPPKLPHAYSCCMRLFTVQLPTRQKKQEPERVGEC